MNAEPIVAWIISGQPSHWESAINARQWGLRRSSDKLWSELSYGDLLIFYCTKPISGVIGFGRVIKKMVGHVPLYPDEKKAGAVLYPLRWNFSIVYVLPGDSWERKRLPIRDEHLVFKSGINPCWDSAAVERLLDMAVKKWKVGDAVAYVQDLLEDVMRGVSEAVADMLDIHREMLRGDEAELPSTCIRKNMIVPRSGWCSICLKAVDIKDSTLVITENGRWAVQGRCDVCNSKVTRLVRFSSRASDRRMYTPEQKLLKSIFSPDEKKVMNKSKCTSNHAPVQKSEVTKEPKSNYDLRLEKIRREYPQAYTPWTIEDDSNLQEEYKNGRRIVELAKIFQRQPGAISSRLRKLGVIE